MNVRILILAIISGLVTTGIFFLVTKNKSAPAAKDVEQIEIVVASVDIPKNQQLTIDNTTIKLVNEDTVHPEVVKEQQEVLGKYVSDDVMADEMIMKHRIRSQEEESAVVSRKISEGHRAISIEVNYDESVSNLVVPEDYVDVLVTTEVEEEEEELTAETEDLSNDVEMETKLLFEKVRVLAVGEQMVEKNERTGEEKTYFTVTLELSQEDALTITQSSHIGSIHLALYSKLDTVAKDTEDKESKKNDSEDD